VAALLKIAAVVLDLNSHQLPYAVAGLPLRPTVRHPHFLLPRQKTKTLKHRGTEEQGMTDLNVGDCGNLGKYLVCVRARALARS
jgi:hypothetical protein